MARVVHFEIPAENPQRAIAFFEKTFGWKADKWDGPVEYWLIKTGEQGTPGIDGELLVKGQGNPMVVNTIDVDDLDAVVAKIESNSGTITAPKMPVPGVGWMAYFKDSEGNVHGIMQSDENAA